MSEKEATKAEKPDSLASPVDRLVSRMEEDECHWDNLTDYIQVGIFNFCSCGRPDDNLEYIMNGLAHIDEEKPEGVDHGEWFDGWKERGLEIFGNEESLYFFFYWADTQELTEHGGSVPGWLTDKGREILNALKSLKADGAFDG